MSSEECFCLNWVKIPYDFDRKNLIVVQFHQSNYPSHGDCFNVWLSEYTPVIDRLIFKIQK